MPYSYGGWSPYETPPKSNYADVTGNASPWSKKSVSTKTKVSGSCSSCSTNPLESSFSPAKETEFPVKETAQPYVKVRRRKPVRNRLGEADLPFGGHSTAYSGNGKQTKQDKKILKGNTFLNSMQLENPFVKKVPTLRQAGKNTSDKSTSKDFKELSDDELKALIKKLGKTTSQACPKEPSTTQSNQQQSGSSGCCCCNCCNCSGSQQQQSSGNVSLSQISQESSSPPQWGPYPLPSSSSEAEPSEPEQSPIIDLPDYDGEGPGEWITGTGGIPWYSWIPLANTAGSQEPNLGVVAGKLVNLENGVPTGFVED